VCRAAYDATNVTRGPVRRAGAGTAFTFWQQDDHDSRTRSAGGASVLVPMQKILLMLGAMLLRRFLPDVGRRLGIPVPITNIVVALV
jgi:hypothetical protein